MKKVLSDVISFLKWVYQPILKVAHFIGKINTFILLTVFYFIFLAFAKLTSVIMSNDLLDVRWKDRESYWKQRGHFMVDKNLFREPY